MKIAIITGITGQDGAYLSKLLIEKGYQVVGVSRSYNHASFGRLNYLNIQNQVKIEECDLTDMSSIFSLFRKYEPAEIYNLSAQSSVGLSFEQPIGTMHYNIISVLNLLECIRILKLNTRVYQASSSEMFGRVQQLPITLETPMHPVSPYAISKATAYWTAINYRESYGLYVCNGILFNHESYLRSSNFFVKKIIKTAIDIKNGIAQKLEVGNIDIKRDFGYAPKYVEAMWRSLQQSKAQDYIICSGKSISLRKIIEHVFQRLSISIDKLHVSEQLYRPSEIDDIYGDNQHAVKQLGWEYDLSFLDVLDLLIEEEWKNMTTKK